VVCRTATARHLTYTKGWKVGDTLDLTKWEKNGMNRWIGHENVAC